jgi:hypothetical protein
MATMTMAFLESSFTVGDLPRSAGHHARGTARGTADTKL